MPVVHVTALRPSDPARPAAMLAGIAAVISPLTGVEPRRIWASFRELQPGEMNLGGVPQPTISGSVVFVDLHLKDRGPAVNDAVLSAVCHHVADGLGVPREDVWGRLYRVESGEVFAGGQVSRWG